MRAADCEVWHGAWAKLNVVTGKRNVGAQAIITRVCSLVSTDPEAAGISVDLTKAFGQSCTPDCAADPCEARPVSAASS